MNRKRNNIIILLLFSIALILLTISLWYGYKGGAKKEEDMHISSETDILTASEIVPTILQSSTTSEQSIVADTEQKDETIDYRSHESQFVAAAENFLEVYYNVDTDQPLEEYIAALELTVTRMDNFMDKLARASGGGDPNAQVRWILTQRKIYVRTQGEKDATALCIAYVGQCITAGNELVSMAYEPLLIRLELKQMEDSEWKVNVVTFEKSLSQLTLDLESMFS